MRGYYGSFIFCYIFYILLFINLLFKILIIKIVLLVLRIIEGLNFLFCIGFIIFSNFIFILNILIFCFICEYIKELCKL